MTDNDEIKAYIRAMQIVLLEKGFYSGEIDGVLGQETIDAIEKTKEEISFG